MTLPAGRAANGPAPVRPDQGGPRVTPGMCTSAISQIRPAGEEWYGSMTLVYAGTRVRPASGGPPACCRTRGCLDNNQEFEVCHGSFGFSTRRKPTA